MVEIGAVSRILMDYLGLSRTSLHGKNIIITEGNLGKATAHLLAQEGASIAYIYRSNAIEANKVVSSLGGSRVHKAIQADLTTESTIKAAIETARLALGGSLHIAINNVGKVLEKPIVDLTEAEYDDILAQNSKSAFFFIKYAAINLEDGGKIISTVTSLLPAFTEQHSLYAGSKALVEHYTRTAAKKLLSRNISVNAIAPGPINIPIVSLRASNATMAYPERIFLDGRLIDVHDIASIIKKSIFDDQWTTGQTIFANEGFATR